MKKYIAALIAVMLLISGSAVAENLFSGVALIEEKEIYYSGSVDGENLGVYILEKDGSAWQIYDTDAMLLEESDSSILLMDYITEQAILLSKEGTVLAQVSGYYGTAIEDDDWFYLGNIALSEDGRQQKVMFEVSAEELYYVTPVCVEEGYLYYIDEREYGPSTFGEGSMSTGSLSRMTALYLFSRTSCMTEWMRYMRYRWMKACSYMIPRTEVSQSFPLLKPSLKVPMCILTTLMTVSFTAQTMYTTRKTERSPQLFVELR